MQKKLFIAIFYFVFSCAHKIEPYILSHNPLMQTYEKQDHLFCDSLKLEFDKVDNIKSKLYWRCRLSLSRYKIQNNTSGNIKYNADVNDLIAKISIKIADAPEAVLLRENKKIDNHHHRQCLAMGFEVDIIDQAKVDDYFSCRRSLIEEYQLLPPFKNSAYLKYKDHSYNIGFAIDIRIDEKIKLYNAAKEKYPTCIKYYPQKKNFKECSEAQDKSRQCFSEIETKKFKKEAEEKTLCQKKSYIQYPNSLLKEEDKQKKDIAKTISNGDYYNGRSLASLGIDSLDKFSANKEKKESNEESDKNINSKDGLYSKFELTNLRRKYISECSRETDDKINRYVGDLKNACESFAIYRVDLD